MEQWSPYAVGIGIGILSWITFLLSDKPIGASTAYARTSGIIEKRLRGEKTKEKAYYKDFAPVIDWEWMLVIGIILGAFLSAILSGSFRFEFVPSRWANHFGNTPFLRFITAVIGGILMGFGARWAGGCTSGHGISGTLQMAVSSWVAAICFFLGGIVAAVTLYSF
ncbi:YeeE/YedE family protein [candidate division KSB3 bacterium]|uniref:YeeE/YedE family protein n=1 Tax=candidate division KSB3 bacterium TaxID=2044937 RepID=A0A9D5Q4V6_9BACT|nr:YeeE/YedE family protein [candidate division KSB3 bacterium]MBD3323592.1 YeeE/YedE family protein [candidate division KSB3 bacterium]